MTSGFVFSQDLSKGEKPTDEEVMWVLRTADREDNVSCRFSSRSFPIGGRKTDQIFTPMLMTLLVQVINDKVNRSEIPAALDIWNSYEKAKPFINKMFDKYDTNKSGKLEVALPSDRLPLYATSCDRARTAVPSPPPSPWIK